MSCGRGVKYQVSCCVGENDAGSQAVIINFQEEEMTRYAAAWALLY
jgi:hypothetical protein